MKFKKIKYFLPLFVCCQFFISFSYVAMPAKGTPLHEAVYNNDINAIRKLIAQGADVNAKDDWGDTPLHWADNVELIRELLKAPGINVNAAGYLGYTPLHRSIETPELAREFLMVPGIDISIKNGEEPALTALEMAEEQSHMPSVISVNARKVLALFQAYQQAKQKAHDQALVLVEARHPRLGMGSPAAIAHEHEFRMIQQELEQQLIKDALMAIPLK